MRTIDLQTWSRAKHFRFYNAFDHPHFNMCVNLEIEALRAQLKEQGVSFNTAIVYLIARSANAIPEFRYRIRGEEVVEHEVVHPSTTVMAKEDVFSFCTFEYCQDFDTFNRKAAGIIASVQEDPVIENVPGRDDLLYMTAIPWVSFTSFMHPMDMQPPDSIPRFAWGKYFQDGGHLKMPLSVQGHHAVMDGVHMGQFYTQIQEYFHNPQAALGKG